MASPITGLYIVGLERLTVSESLGRGDKVGEIFTLTNDAGVISSLLPRGADKLLGTIETKFLTKGGLVAYHRVELEESGEHDDANNKLLQWLGTVGIFLHYLWFDRDHAAGQEVGYFIRSGTFGGGFGVVATRNMFPHSICDSETERPTITLSRDELRQVRRFYAQDEHSIVVEPQTAARRLGRRGRAFYFVQAARHAQDLGVKIANYSTSLEALFSTSETELTHQLSERVAAFLERDVDARLALYRSLKKAYGIRSKFVHGAGGSHTVDDLKTTSRFLDDLLRRIFRVLHQDESLSKRFDNPPGNDDSNFFLRLVFGTTSPASSHS